MNGSSDSTAPTDPTRVRRAIAQRVADAHRELDPALVSFLSGSVVEGLADDKSDVDMSVVLGTLPSAAVLEGACARAGGGPWFWTGGAVEDGGLVVAFRVDGIEVQIGYTSHLSLQGQLDGFLVRHNPDTPLHKLGEGILKAEPLVGPMALEMLKARLAAFPRPLAVAMAHHFLATPTPWRALAQIVDRDADLWCRELEVEACYRMLGLLAAANGRYFTRFQVKRMRKLIGGLTHAPARVAERIEAILAAPPRQAVPLLHALEADVLAVVADRLPEVDIAAARARLAAVDLR